MNFNRTDPLTTEFLLGVGNQEKPCPSYYGKDEDKKKVKMVLQQEIHPEVHAKWGNLMCHCQRIPKIRLSKTAKNLNKVFLTCGGSTQDARCKFFQWIHTPLYPLPSDPMPDWLRKTYKPRPLKSFTKENREWMRQAEQNAERWKKQQSNQAWLNQFAESAKQHHEQREAKKSVNPWKASTFFASPEIAKAYKKTEGWKEIQAKKSVNPYKIPLPSTFHWSPEIAEVIKKRDQWDDINAMANNEFQTSVSKTFGSLPPSDASLASYLQKRKNQGKRLSPADEKYLQACHQQCKPVKGFWPQNEAAIADFVKGTWPFGDLPEKVCSLASYCRKRKQQGLPLTPAQERFFDQLVDLHKDVKNEGPAMILF